MSFLVNSIPFLRNLDAIANTRVRKAQDTMRDGALEIREEAQALAPLDQGELEKAELTRFKRTATGAEIDIVFDKAYAGVMHEGVYTLGPASRQKDATISSQFGGVGPKYLERPLDGLSDEIMKAIAKALVS